MTDNLDDIPVIIEPLVFMENPNDNIPIYEGEFSLMFNQVIHRVNGQITFNWFPVISVRFSGTVGNFESIYRNIKDKHTIRIHEMAFGECLITNFSSTGTISGLVIGESILNDKTIAVEKIHFEVPNMNDFLGEVVKKGSGTYANRIKLINKKYTILLDKRIEYDKLRESLKSKGGFIILYTGEVTKQKGSLSFDEGKDLLEGLQCFLSFINGRRISGLFRKGIAHSQILWHEYKPYPVDQYKFVQSWSNLETDFNSLWGKFSELWANEESRRLLDMAIHWYNEANSGSGYAEGSIVMIQNALELLYNWIIIEERSMLIGEDAENISASNKIRLLLSHIKVSFSTPIGLSDFHRFCVKEKMDGPEAIVQIRNSIVHSQKNKRKKLYTIDGPTRAGALALGIWYVELILLHTFGYVGIYNNRCNRTLFGAQYVPWADKVLTQE